MLLVGGTSKIPLVRRFVTEKLAGKEPEPFDEGRSDDLRGPGGGHRLGHPAGRRRASTTTPTASSSSIRCAPTRSTSAARSILDPIIKRGADIPCSFTKTYHPVADPAERVVISVYEGDVYDDPESPENVKLAEIPWEFKPPRPQRDGGLDVTFEYGDDGILTVQIHDPSRQPEEALRHPAGRRGPAERRRRSSR